MLPSKAQIVSSAKGHGDMQQTLTLLRNQLQSHVDEIATLKAKLAALEQKLK